MSNLLQMIFCIKERHEASTSGLLVLPHGFRPPQINKSLQSPSSPSPSSFTSHRCRSLPAIATVVFQPSPTSPYLQQLCRPLSQENSGRHGGTGKREPKCSRTAF
nr:hypothetical protein Iba_chr08cCG10830 [Ipomoea batatas]